MADVNYISKKLVDQLRLLETNASETANRFKDVETYIECRLRKLKQMIPLASNDWANELSNIIDLFDEVQKVLEKVDELEGTIIDVQEVPLESILLEETCYD